MAGSGGFKPEGRGSLEPLQAVGGLGVTEDEHAEARTKANPLPCPQFPLPVKAFTTAVKACWVLKWQKDLYLACAGTRTSFGVHDIPFAVKEMDFGHTAAELGP